MTSTGRFGPDSDSAESVSTRHQDSSRVLKPWIRVNEKVKKNGKAREKGRREKGERRKRQEGETHIVDFVRPNRFLLFR